MSEKTNDKPVKKKRVPKKPFKKGNKLAKGHGRPSLTEEQRVLRLTTRTQFQNLLMQYMTLNREEIDELIKSKTLPIIDLAVLKHLKNMFDSGSMDRIDWTNNHIMGKPKETTNINFSGAVENTNTIDLKKLSKKELILLKELAEKSNEKN